MHLSDGVVTLRTPDESDAPAVAALVLASLAELSPWMPWATPRYDAAAAIEWMRGVHDPTELAFVVTDTATGELLGSCGLNQFDPANARANLGYWIRSDRTGRGYATRATVLVAAHGHGELGLHRCEIGMSVRNDASRRVAERAGARHEGVLHGRLLLHGEFHDAHSFVLLPGDVAAP